MAYRPATVTHGLLRWFHAMGGTHHVLQTSALETVEAIDKVESDEPLREISGYSAALRCA